jgi:hypothetical protein
LAGRGLAGAARAGGSLSLLTLVVQQSCLKSPGVNQISQRALDI